MWINGVWPYLQRSHVSASIFPIRRERECVSALCAHTVSKQQTPQTGEVQRLEPERYDCPGNLCAKVAENWVKLETLLPSMEEVRAKHTDGFDILNIFECTHVMPLCTKSMDRIMKCRMSRRLSPDRRDGFDNLSSYCILTSLCPRPASWCLQARGICGSS